MKRGFTLIEVMAVLAVMAILFAIALPNIVAMRRVALDKTVRAELSNVRDAMNGYFKDHEYSYDGATLAKLGPYGYLHFEPGIIVNLVVASPLEFMVTVASDNIIHSMHVNSNTGEVTIH